MEREWRIRVIRIVFIGIFFLLSVRLYFLQVHPVEKVSENYTNHQTEIISDMNYMLLDKNGKDLLDYEKDYVVVIDSKPFSLNNYGEALQGLLTFNFIMKDEVQDFNFADIAKNKGKAYYKVSKETYDKINKIKNVKGIYTYINDRASKKEAWSVSGMFSSLKSINSNEDSLEASLNNLLADNEVPKENFYLDEKTVYGKKELSVKEENRNLKLTIDKEISEKIKAVVLDEKYKEIENIGVVLMESDSGKISAMIQKDESKPNINLGIAGIGYEPGSIFKLITYGTALENAKTYQSENQKCKLIKCHRFHGEKITSKEAIVQSCNDAFSNMAEKIGLEKLIEDAKSMGLFNQVLKLDGNGKREATGGYIKEDVGIDNIAIGQSMTTTPIQIVGAANTFFNGGIYVKPQIIESITNFKGETIQGYEKVEKKIYTEITTKSVLEAMNEVVTRGTGEKAYIEGKKIYGKTGSGTYRVKNEKGEMEERTHCWFTGSFNIDEKKYTMNILVPEVKSEKNKEVGGGTIAGPIFKDIVKCLDK